MSVKTFLSIITLELEATNSPVMAVCENSEFITVMAGELKYFKIFEEKKLSDHSIS